MLDEPLCWAGAITMLVAIGVILYTAYSGSPSMTDPCPACGGDTVVLCDRCLQPSVMCTCDPEPNES